MNIGRGIMATKSFLKTINLKTKRDTSNFFYALDKAII